MDATATDGLRPAPPRHGPRRTARGDRAVAVCLTVLINALAGAALMRAPTLRPARADVQDRPIEVMWIERAPPPSARAPAVPDVRKPSAPRPDPVAMSRPVPEPALQAVVVPRGGQIPAGEEPAPPGDDGARSIADDANARMQDGYARRGVFNARPVNPFARRDDGPFRMRDNSLGGRLQRMARRADCAELRAQLRAGGDPDAIVRALVERRCT